MSTTACCNSVSKCIKMVLTNSPSDAGYCRMNTLASSVRTAVFRTISRERHQKLCEEKGQQYMFLAKLRIHYATNEGTIIMHVYYSISQTKILIVFLELKLQHSTLFLLWVCRRWGEGKLGQWTYLYCACTWRIPKPCSVQTDFPERLLSP